MTRADKLKNLDRSISEYNQYVISHNVKHVNLFFDGLNHFVRNFLPSYGSLQDSSSKDVSGLYYSIKSLIAILKSFTSSTISRNDLTPYLIFEHRRSKKLNMIYPAYKQNRKLPKVLTLDEVEKNEMFKYNLVEFISFCQLFPGDLMTFNVDYVEGDFVIAYLIYYLSSKATEKTLNIIVSTDKDFYQLLNLDNVMVFNPISNVLITSDNFNTVLRLSTQISPSSFLIYKLLVGDKSDNIERFAGNSTSLKTINMLNSLTESSISSLQDLFSLTENVLNDKKIKLQKRQYDLLTNIAENKDKLLTIFKIIDLSYTNVLNILSTNDILKIMSIYENTTTRNENRHDALKNFFNKHNFSTDFLFDVEHFLFKR